MMKEEGWDAVGILGSVMGVAGPSIEVLKDWLQITAGCLGLILVVFSIRHKFLEIRKLKADGKQKQPREPTEKG